MGAPGRRFGFGLRKEGKGGSPPSAPRARRRRGGCFGRPVVGGGAGHLLVAWMNRIIWTTVVTGVRVQELQLRDAKATLSAVVDSARRGEPSVITRHGKKEAVVLGYEAWKTLSSVPSFARLLMACPLEAGDLPERDSAAPREANL